MAATELAQARKKIRAIVIEEILATARLWEPITDEYLSSKELLQLTGADAKIEYSHYRELLFFCEMAVQPNTIHDLFPDNLRNCFAGRTVKIVPFKGRYADSKGAKIEYRVAIADLTEDRQARALGIVAKRTGGFLKLDERTKLALPRLAYRHNKSVWEIIDELVRIEMKDGKLGQIQDSNS